MGGVRRRTKWKIPVLGIDGAVQTLREKDAALVWQGSAKEYDLVTVAFSLRVKPF